jgi:hypothetical protein
MAVVLTAHSTQSADSPTDPTNTHKPDSVTLVLRFHRSLALGPVACSLLRSPLTERQNQTASSPCHRAFVHPKHPIALPLAPITSAARRLSLLSLSLSLSFSPPVPPLPRTRPRRRGALAAHASLRLLLRAPAFPLLASLSRGRCAAAAAAAQCNRSTGWRRRQPRRTRWQRRRRLRRRRRRRLPRPLAPRSQGWAWPAPTGGSRESTRSSRSIGGTASPA